MTEKLFFLSFHSPQECETAFETFQTKQKKKHFQSIKSLRKALVKSKIRIISIV